MKINKSVGFMLAGAGAGFLIGSSMGIAIGGGAYNGALFTIPLGAFVGWLIANSRHVRKSGDEHFREENPRERETGTLAQIFGAALAILATIWNFQIELLRSVGLLDTFVRQPVLFLGLCIVISMFFPPFLPLYFFAWLGALHFGISEKNQYRAPIRIP